MIMIAQLLLSLSILVAVHEMGHLLAAKYFGMRVEQFSIGFPPKIWSFRKGETEYALSAIPLGGYVKISGMIDESLDTEAMKQDPQSTRSKPASVWRTTSPTLIAEEGRPSRMPPVRPRTASTNPSFRRSCTTFIRWLCEIRCVRAISPIEAKRSGRAARCISTRSA